MSEETQAPETQAPEAEETKTPKRGVGTVVKEAIRDGSTNEEALAVVQAEFPHAKTSKASVNWYRNKMRADGEDVPTARELNKQRAAAVKTDETPAASTDAEPSTDEADPLD